MASYICIFPEEIITASHFPHIPHLLRDLVYFTAIKDSAASARDVGLVELNYCSAKGLYILLLALSARSFEYFKNGNARTSRWKMLRWFMASA